MLITDLKRGAVSGPAVRLIISIEIIIKDLFNGRYGKVLDNQLLMIKRL